MAQLMEHHVVGLVVQGGHAVVAAAAAVGGGVDNVHIVVRQGEVFLPQGVALFLSLIGDGHQALHPIGPEGGAKIGVPDVCLCLILGFRVLTLGAGLVGNHAQRVDLEHIGELVIGGTAHHVFGSPGGRRIEVILLLCGEAVAHNQQDQGVLILQGFVAIDQLQLADGGFLRGFRFLRSRGFLRGFRFLRGSGFLGLGAFFGLDSLLGDGVRFLSRSQGGQDSDVRNRQEDGQQHSQKPCSPVLFCHLHSLLFG